MIAHKVAINKVFKIPTEPMQVFSEKLDKNVDIPVPKSHLDLGVVSCRLISSKKRKGMVSETLSNKNKSIKLRFFQMGIKSNAGKEKPSKYFIFHVI